MNLLKTLRGRLRVIALLEGVSFLLLLAVGMPLKYYAGLPAPNRVIGMAHGVLFVLYVLLVIQCALAFRWGGRKTALALLASIIPFGTFWADVRLFRD